MLGSSSWRVVGVRKNRLFVEPAPGSTPTVPWWLGDIESRTSEVGLRVGELRRAIAQRLSDPKLGAWLRKQYFVDEFAATALIDYVREQQAATGMVPDEQRLLVENWRDELGRKNVIVHSPYGSRINRTWGVAIAAHAKKKWRQEWAVSVSNDVLLLTRREEETESGPFARALLAGPTKKNLVSMVDAGAQEAAGQGGAFREAAVCGFQVLRGKHGKRLPPWLQSHRAAELFEAAGGHADYPIMLEVLREYIHDTLDVPALERLLETLEKGGIELVFRETESPSPFAHSVLVEGIYKSDHQMGRDRRAHLLHLHRKVLQEVLSEAQMADLLDKRAIERLERQSLHRSEASRARTAEELGQALRDLGDVPATLEAVQAIVEGDAAALLKPLLAEGSIVGIRLPECDQDPVRLVPTDLWHEYRAATAAAGRRRTPVLMPRLGKGGIDLGESAASKHIPAKWRKSMPQPEARSRIIERYLRCRGPVTCYEIMNANGWALHTVEAGLESLVAEGKAAKGIYTREKPFPQWLNRVNLEKIHKYTMEFLRVDLAPCEPHELVDFATRWQHRHPATRLTGIEGLRAVIAQLQGFEIMQGALETEVLPARVADYAPEMLDRLMASGEVRWARVDHNRVRRGIISLCLRRDIGWLSRGAPPRFDGARSADIDIRDEIIRVRDYFKTHPTAYFDDVRDDTGFAEDPVARALWHLAWCGELTCDTFECIRYARFFTSLSACYDLDSTPGKIAAGRMSPDRVMKRLREKKLDARLGRWSATERLAPPRQPLPESDITRRWASLLLQRWGVVSRDILQGECAAPPWEKLVRAFKRMELTGRVNRGFFIKSHHGEQFGLPEAIELLRDCRARRGGGKELGYLPDEEIFSITSHDPANLYATCLDIVDDRGEGFKRPYRNGNMTVRAVLQAGQPLLYQHHQLVVRFIVKGIYRLSYVFSI